MKSYLLFSLFFLFVFSCGKPGLVRYPEQGKTGDNILSLEQTEYTGQLSMTAFLNRESSVSVKIESLASNTNTARWSVDLFESRKWKFYNLKTNSQSFDSKRRARECHLPITFTPGKYQITISENGNLLPPRVKEIEVN